ncbi:MAG: hypothetical protein IJU69_00135 [Bacteroidales bacterium]|nr:hypothetical protein [Bacteroidales bacterium]
MVPAKIDQVREIEPERLRYFLEHRESPDIPAEIQDYILKLDCVARLTHKNNLSVRKAIERIQQEFPGTTFAQARSVYYDALDYFYLDDRLSARAWDNVYAEQFEDMKKLAIAANKLEIAYKCAVKAHELRTKERESKDINWTAPVFLINTTVTAESLGFKSQKLADIAHRNEDDKLREMIMGLATTDAEKARMLADAGIKAVVVEQAEELIPDEQ